jgi:hypothetical protein
MLDPDGGWPESVMQIPLIGGSLISITNKIVALNQGVTLNGGDQINKA